MWDRLYLPLVRKNKDTRTDDMIEVLMHRVHQLTSQDGFMIGYLLFLVEYSERLSLFVTEVIHDQNKLGKRLKQRRKLELEVPKNIGRYLQGLVAEHEREERERLKWQREHR